ncbi:hypothetical protein CLI64_24595 [Nostoc sp. CENA543]|uniref:COP23 domain-containing protein n=1 Tax=Nostoc sp. CENA543 TaxID=1869241 RepID=UPI000CA0B344|nr:COP23 domain-containing protein [Nostoc sp. CENA543]AUT03338.1 hypothetical protein CLI64_24595 [Nostoc sp. CENA543]
MELFKVYSRNQASIILTLITVIVAATITTIDTPSYAQSTTFYCGKSKGLPVTFARTQDGRKLPVIRWTSNNYFPPPWTAQRRCVEVSQRFQRSYNNRTLKYISSGILNKQPVVCAGISKDTVCTSDNLLFTLKRGANPKAVVTRILDNRGLADGLVHSESESDDITVDFDLYLERVEPEK